MPDEKVKISQKIQGFVPIFTRRRAFEPLYDNPNSLFTTFRPSLVNFSLFASPPVTMFTNIKRSNSNEPVSTNNQFFLKDKFCIFCGEKSGGPKVKCLNCNRVFHHSCLYAEVMITPDSWKCFECCHKKMSMYEEKSLTRVLAKLELYNYMENQSFYFDKLNIDNNYHTEYFISLYSVTKGEISTSEILLININDFFDITVDNGEKNITNQSTAIRNYIKVKTINTLEKSPKLGLFLLIYSINTYRNNDINDNMLLNSLNSFPVSYSKSLIKDTLTFNDDDKDDEIMVNSDDLELNLCDPVSLSRINIPVRSVDCSHIQCFDLKTFLLISFNNQRMLKCPICNKYCDNMRLMIDDVILNILRNTNKNKIEMKSDGSWSIIKEEIKVETVYYILYL